MTRRNILLIITGIVMVVLIAGGVWWYIQSRNEVALPQIPAANQNATNVEAPVANTNTEVAPEAPTTDNTAAVSDPSSEAAALRVGRIAVERYGTYSNRNNFENIVNVQPFMTERYKQETNGFIEKYTPTTGPNVTNDFYGITTKVLAISTIQFTDKKAIQLSVGTQRVETVGNSDPRTFNQDAIVNAVYVDDAWKIDAIQWK